MQRAQLNRVSTAVPRHEVHDYFVRCARERLADSPRDQRDDAPEVDHDGLFRPGADSGTAARMKLYERHAHDLAERADLGPGAAKVRHLIVTSCTGFFAPGIDLAMQRRCGLPTGVERTVVGFMGCTCARPRRSRNC